MTEQNIKGMKIIISEPVPPFPSEPPYRAWGQKIANKVARPGTTVDYVTLREEARGGDGDIWMAQKAFESEKMGYDAFVVGCAGDVNLRGCRARVTIPVVGATEASVLISSTLGYKFSIIVTASEHKAELDHLVKGYGLIEKLASIRCPQQTMRGIDDKKKIEILTAEMSRVIKEDGAEAVFVAHVPDSILLKMQGINEIDGVPVVDSFSASIKLAEILVDLKRAFKMGVCKKSIYKSPLPGWEQHFPFNVV